MKVTIRGKEYDASRVTLVGERRGFADRLTAKLCGTGADIVEYRSFEAEDRMCHAVDVCDIEIVDR